MDEIGKGSSSGVVAAPLPPPKPASTVPQSIISKHQALDASLAKVESKAKYWKQEA